MMKLSRRSAKFLLLATTVAMLSGCPSPPRPTPPVIAETAPAERARPTDAVNYTVDGAASEVLILVGRGGTLARLGHNHVISTLAVQGRVWTSQALASSGFELEFPVTELLVDVDAARNAVGGEFAAPVPEADKLATRKNMLRTEVLDGEHFPKVTLQSVNVSGTVPQLQIETRIALKEVSRTVSVPVTLTTEGERLIATGEFTLLQTDFGIKPFSVALGALQVQDALEIRFKIVAERTAR
jgi:polyisoprenoid-binding protein YceI